MTTFNRHPWNFMPMEMLAHIFSFLPVRDRHNVTRMCKLWASAISSASVWHFTEVHYSSCKTEEQEEDDGGNTSRTLLEKIKPYMGHIKYLKLVLDISLELNQRLACTILDVIAGKSRRLQGIQIMCYGYIPCCYSGPDLLKSLRRLFQAMDQATMKHVDLRHMPFLLENRTISLVASCSPNLRTLLINNHTLTMLRTEMTVEVLRTCPKLSTLGISYSALSQRVFQELLRPDREPFKYLEMFYDGLDNDISEDCWISVRQRHPGFRVGLEFAGSVTEKKMTEVLKPYLPISQLHFNAFIRMATLVKLVAKFYAPTLEKLVLHPVPTIQLNMALIWLATSCVHLKEIHCFCVLSKWVAVAFERHCRHLRKYTLSHTGFSPDYPPMVFL